MPQKSTHLHTDGRGYYLRWHLPIYTPTAETTTQGTNLHTGSSWGFSLALKDTFTLGQEKSGSGWNCPLVPLVFKLISFRHSCSDASVVSDAKQCYPHGTVCLERQNRTFYCVSLCRLLPDALFINMFRYAGAAWKGPIWGTCLQWKKRESRWQVIWPTQMAS